MKEIEGCKIEEITLESKEKIESLLLLSNASDIHFYPKYIELFQNYGCGKGIYIHFQSKEGFILCPYFIRDIPNKQGYFDLISPWYFGGFIHSYPDIRTLKKYYKIFINMFNDYCCERKIVSEFQRYNPIICNDLLDELDCEDIHLDRKIVYIDLHKDLEKIRSEYNKHARKNIRKSKEAGISVYRSLNIHEDIEKFKEVYLMSMMEKNAKNFYLFNNNFFNDLVKKLGDEVDLFFIEYEGKIISGSIVIGKDGILHDYLRGTNSEYFHLKPNDLMIDEITKWGKESGFKYYILGGGYTNEIDDTLLRFKMKFSSDSINYYLWKKIHNQEVYDELTSEHGLKFGLKQVDSTFFPEYRTEKWEDPVYDKKNLTQWNWMVQYHDNISLGEYVDIGAFTYINAKYGVEISDNVQIGSHCSIYSHSTIGRKAGKVSIGKNVMIGSHSVIMPGVSIGENSVIGAFSFVNKNIPSNVLALGIPAKIMKEITEKSEK